MGTAAVLVRLLPQRAAKLLVVLTPCLPRRHYRSRTTTRLKPPVIITMAPSYGNNRATGSPVPQRGNSARPSIVPAIPLPYLQHQRRAPTLPTLPQTTQHAQAQDNFALAKTSEGPSGVPLPMAANDQSSSAQG